MTLRTARTLTSLTAGALLLASITGCSVLDRAGAGGCGREYAPLISSRAAKTYVKAVNAAQPGWVAVSDRIRSHGERMDVEDYRNQVSVDEKFLADVQAITFPAKSQASATRFEDALGAYVDFVRTSADQPGYLSANPALDSQVNSERAAASSALRKSLHLQANRCVLDRP